MKMIASTKLIRAQREMNRARSYGTVVDSASFFNSLSTLFCAFLLTSFAFFFDAFFL